MTDRKGKRKWQRNCLKSLVNLIPISGSTRQPEGDKKGLRQLAEENGLQEEAEQYMKGQTDELCDPLTAALGKLKIDREEGDSVFYDDVTDYLMANCDDIKFAMAVRKKGKRISEAAGLIWEEARRQTTTIHGKQVHYCGPMRGYQLIREYYLGGGEQ